MHKYTISVHGCKCLHCRKLRLRHRVRLTLHRIRYRFTR